MFRVLAGSVVAGGIAAISALLPQSKTAENLEIVTQIVAPQAIPVHAAHPYADEAQSLGRVAEIGFTARTLIAAGTVHAIPKRVSSVAPGDAETREAVVRSLQFELRRAGCYNGAIDGAWTPSTRAAADDLVLSSNSKLPTTEPDYVLLALARRAGDGSCGGAANVRLAARADGGAWASGSEALLAATPAAAPQATASQVTGSLQRVPPTGRALSITIPDRNPDRAALTAVARALASTTRSHASAGGVRVAALGAAAATPVGTSGTPSPAATPITAVPEAASPTRAATTPARRVARVGLTQAEARERRQRAQAGNRTKQRAPRFEATRFFAALREQR
ncbi:MAG: peptidoglycan-binding protein [Hyphomicrobiaceae bacterium]